MRVVELGEDPGYDSGRPGPFSSSTKGKGWPSSSGGGWSRKERVCFWFHAEQRPSNSTPPCPACVIRPIDHRVFCCTVMCMIVSRAAYTPAHPAATRSPVPLLLPGVWAPRPHVRLAERWCSLAQGEEMKAGGHHDRKQLFSMTAAYT